MGRIQRTREWLSVLPSTVNGTELGAQEWSYSIFLCYGIYPLDLPDHYNSCGAAFSIFHDLDFNKGGLITVRQKELRDGVANLAGKAFTPTHVHDNPKTFIGCAVCGGKAKAKAKFKEASPQGEGGEKGGLLIRDLYMQGTDSIHDMHAVNTDAISYQSKNPKKCMETSDQDKKKNCLHACLNKRWHFIPFVTTVDGLFGVEAEATLKRIASRLATNQKDPYSCTYGYVKIVLSINLVRATHRCIWGPGFRSPKPV